MTPREELLSNIARRLRACTNDCLVAQLPAEALTILAAARALCPNDPDLRAMHATVIDAISRLVPADPDAAALEHELLRCYSRPISPQSWPNEALTATGLRLRSEGFASLAERAFRDASRLYPNLPWPLIHLGVQLRDRGALDDARTCFDNAIAVEPDHLHARLEAAATAEKLGDNSEVQRHLIQAIHHHPRASEPRSVLAALYRRLSRTAEARAILSFEPSDELAHLVMFERALVAWSGDRDAKELLLIATGSDSTIASFGRYLNEGVMHKRIAPDILTPASHIYLQAHADDDKLLLAQHAVRRSIVDAVIERRPFSFIRLGDGEGALLSYLDTQEALIPVERALHNNLLGREIWDTWLGRPISREDVADLASLQTALTEAVRDADIVGVPRLADAARGISYIEYHGCLRAHQFVRSIRTRGLTTVQMNVLLHQSGAYYELLSGLASISLITCHPGLAAAFEQFKPGLRVRTYLIPTQAGNQLVFGYCSHDKPHFPDVFNQMYEDLMIPDAGHVVLVAAGVFGKIYCNIIKQRGGIGLDIGAMADAFAGFNTRASITALFDEPLLRHSG